MAQPDPFVAFLTAIQDAQAAGGGRPNAFVPGAQGVSGAAAQQPTESGGTPAAIAGGASVPGTATTGPSLAADLGSGFDGRSGELNPLDPLTFQAFQAVAGQEPSDPGDLGAGVTGGDLGALLSVIGGPAAMATILGSLVTTDALGMPLDPSLLTTTSLAELAFNGGREAGTLGVNPELGNVTINPNGAVVNNIRGGVFGGSGGGSGGEGGGDLGNRGGGNADQFDTPEFGA